MKILKLKSPYPPIRWMARLWVSKLLLIVLLLIMASSAVIAIAEKQLSFAVLFVVFTIMLVALPYVIRSYSNKRPPWTLTITKDEISLDSQIIQWHDVLSLEIERLGGETARSTMPYQDRIVINMKDSSKISKTLYQDISTLKGLSRGLPKLKIIDSFLVNDIHIENKGFIRYQAKDYIHEFEELGPRAVIFSRENNK